MNRYVRAGNLEHSNFAGGDINIYNFFNQSPPPTKQPQEQEDVQRRGLLM